MEKILIIDDDEALRRLIRIELSENYEVVDTGEAEHGLALAMESRPDAILLDLRMPNYSGYELLQTFTSLSRTRMIPVVVVSGEAGAQTKEYCKELGAASYFEKPIDFDALRACLRETVKSQTHTPRSEVRVRLRVFLKLRGTDIDGKAFEEPAITEDVSVTGFLCSCTAKIATDGTIDVLLGRNGAEYVGKARVVHATVQGIHNGRYGCRFVEKTGPWVLK